MKNYITRAKRELVESKRKLKLFNKKYLTQIKSKKLTFFAPIAKEEKNIK